MVMALSQLPQTIAIQARHYAALSSTSSASSSSNDLQSLQNISSAPAQSQRCNDPGVCKTSSMRQFLENAVNLLQLHSAHTLPMDVRQWVEASHQTLAAQVLNPK